MEHLEIYIEYAAKIVESIGVIIITGGSIYFLLRFMIFSIYKRKSSYKNLRHALGKVILLGLEILVAADIIATVSTKPNMNSVLVLAVIVLIRTFLSYSIQVELEGKFPWQKKEVNEEK